MEIIALFDKPTVGHPQDTRGENQQETRQSLPQIHGCSYASIEASIKVDSHAWGSGCIPHKPLFRYSCIDTNLYI